MGNILQVQKLGSQYKRERDAALLLPPREAHLDAAFGDTDTDALIKAAYSHNLTDFIKLIKGAFKRTFNSWLDTLLLAEGDILVFEPAAVVLIHRQVNQKQILNLLLEE